MSEVWEDSEYFETVPINYYPKVKITNIDLDYGDEIHNYQSKIRNEIIKEDIFMNNDLSHLLPLGKSPYVISGYDHFLIKQQKEYTPIALTSDNVQEADKDEKLIIEKLKKIDKSKLTSSKANKTGNSYTRDEIVEILKSLNITTSIAKKQYLIGLLKEFMSKYGF